MPTWTVTVDYDGQLPASEQETIDLSIDRLADQAGEVVDSGSGAGFGRRHLDYAFDREDEAHRLATSVESSFATRDQIDLSVHVIEASSEKTGA